MPLPIIRATTILAVRRDGSVIAGFAGSVADAITLFEKFEEKLDRFPGNLPKAAVELAKEWRSDRVLRRLEAMLICIYTNTNITVLEPTA